MHAILSCVLGLSLASSFEEGKVLYQQLEFERAAVRLQTALSGVEDDEVLAQIQSWLGLTYLQLDEEASARVAFAQAVAHDVFVTLPPESPPRAFQLIDEARQAERDRRRRVEMEAAAEREGGYSGFDFGLMVSGAALAIGGAVLGAGSGVVALIEQDAALRAPSHQEGVARKTAAESAALLANVGWLVAASGVALTGVTFLVGAE